MSLPPQFDGNDRVFNNADSFAMAFDDEWKKLKSEKKSNTEKLKISLATLKNHPFAKASPSRAKEIAEFRIRLLNL